MCYYYDVAPSRPLMGTLTYFCTNKLELGSKVQIPIGKSKCDGFIVADSKEIEGVELKEIEKFSEQSYFSKKNLDFYVWVSKYYHYPLGEILSGINPKFVPKRLIDFDKFENTEVKLESPLFELNKEQKNAIEKIDDGFCSLLHGVTGSGKTEVYIEYAKKIISQNKTVLIVVPEIALTPQLLDRISKHFRGEIAIIHSSISEKQRLINWMNIHNGKCKLIIGARSAIFAPFKNLGFVVVDEEHEASYKQDDRLRYNARNLALVLAKMHNAKVLLSSATPSCESYYNAMTGKYNYVKISSRVNMQNLPVSVLIDLKKEKMILQDISEKLFLEIENKLLKKEQSILYINRRGYSNTVICKDCAYNFKCPNCDITLTEHKGKNKFICHYCSYERNLPNYCPNCKSDNLISCGTGTEKIVEQIKNLFPSARVIRMDSDEISSKNKLKLCLKKINDGEVDIIVGTQILSKGHDFPNVTLVGIINADTLLMLPDFRASEKTFQSIVQVSGRSGRFKSGKVLLQTFMPEHYAVKTATENDFDGFYKKELEIREEVLYPPYSNICSIEISSKICKKADSFSDEAKLLLLKIIKANKFKDVSVLGPAPMSIFIVNNRFRYSILLKSKSKNSLNKTLNVFNLNFKKDKLVRVKIDIDS